MIGVLLDAGADANAPDPAGDTPLMNAARVGSLDAVTLLLDRGAKIDAADADISADRADGGDPREPARRREVADLARRIGQREDTSRSRTAVDLPELGARLRSWHRDRARRAPADADRAHRFPAGCRRCCTPRATGAWTSLRMLLEAGANINERDANDITPLIIAITNNHPDVARFLIDRGADIKAVDWYGRTALWAAVETRNMDVDNGTFVNSIDRAPYLELIQVLLDTRRRPRTRARRKCRRSAGSSCASPARSRGWTSPDRRRF